MQEQVVSCNLLDVLAFQCEHTWHGSSILCTLATTFNSQLLVQDRCIVTISSQLPPEEVLAKLTWHHSSLALTSLQDPAMPA
jgi:hypothetical protein